MTRPISPSSIRLASAFVLLLLCGFPASLQPQTSQSARATVSNFPGVPTGTCSGNALAINTLNGTLSNCVNGSWNQVTNFGFPGAVPDEKRAFDGAMASLVTNGTSTSPATATYTTSGTFTNEIALTIEAWNGAATLSGAAGSSVFSITPAASKYAAAVNTQSIAGPAGSVTSMGGTLSASSSWMGLLIPLVNNSASISAHGSNSTQQASGSSSISVTKPTLSAGDFLVGCVIATNSSNAVSQGNGFGWQIIQLSVNGTDQTTCWAKVAGSSEPANYAFSQTGTGAISAFVVSLSNVLYPDELFTSASATFGNSAIGKDICVAAGNTSNLQPQSCGNIGAVFSANTLVGYGVWNTGTNTSAMEYRYGTDNTTALQNAINSYPNGGTVYLPAGGMMICGRLAISAAPCISWPAPLPLNLKGQGSAGANWEQNNVNNALAMGSELVVANSGLNGAALLITASTTGCASGSGGVSITSFHLEDFTVWGGAGKDSDGGGGSSQGIQACNIFRFLMDNVEVANFGGDDLLISGGTGSFYGLVLIENSYFHHTGGAHVHIGNGNAGGQNIALFNNFFDGSQGPNVELGGGLNIWTLNMSGNSFSRSNNALGQIVIDSASTITGCDIGANYWETDNASNQVLIQNMNLLPCRWAPQTIIYGGAGQFTGASPALTGTGACATVSLANQLPGNALASGTWFGPWVGKVKCNGSTTSPSTLTISVAPTSQNGWNCSGSDATSGLAGGQLGISNTTCELTFTTVTSADVISFQVTPF